jgi:1-deoxy-D-xylulose-5-phosphate synthase
VLSRPKGAKVALVALGSMVSVAWEAAQMLGERGIPATVVNARFIRPLDVETLTQVALETGFMVTLEENVRTGGFGQQVRDALSQTTASHVPLEIVALPDAFVEHGTQPIIRAEAGLSTDAVLQKVLARLGNSVNLS